MKIEVTNLELRVIQIALITRYHYYMDKSANVNSKEERESIILVANMYKHLYDSLERFA